MALFNHPAVYSNELGGLPGSLSQSAFAGAMNTKAARIALSRRVRVSFFIGVISPVVVSS
jgi:hypothetical protein